LVIVWKIELDNPQLASPRRRAWLDDEERRRFASFVRADDARAYAAAHTSLREILATTVACDPTDVTFHREPFGRPKLAAGSLDFNMSHAGNLCLVAISRVHRVGVDLERLDRPIEPGFLNLIATPAEKVKLESSVDRDKNTLLLWVAKEAVLKASGSGLTRDPRSIAVYWEQRGISGVALDRSAPKPWNLITLELGREWAAVLATTAAPRALRNVPRTYQALLL
jgi:4'-phosphopantetheinyl transferase